MKIVASIVFLFGAACALAEAPVTIKGIAYVQKQDGSQMRMTPMTVYAIPMEGKAALDAPQDGSPQEVELPKPLAVAQTDVNGAFVITVELDRPFFIYATGGYNNRFGRYIGFEWSIALDDISDRNDLELNNQNSRPPARKVVILDH